MTGGGYEHYKSLASGLTYGKSQIASKLNLPSIALRLSLGFGRWRFGRVCQRPLLSPAAPVLCFTEQLSSLASNSIAIFQWKIAVTS